jgi:ribonuclease PH
MTRPDGRGPLDLRPLRLTPGFSQYAEGSVLAELGQTKVLVTVSLLEGVPRHVRGKSGWLSAEYSLLPRSTRERKERERSVLSGRTAEIQRLLGRAFRATVDLELFRGKSLIVDADVLQADGSTRATALLGGYAALHLAMDRWVRQGILDEWPLRDFAAVSLGWMGEETLWLDLSQSEDEAAWADLTVVGTAERAIIEVNGSGEGHPIPREIYLRLIDLGLAAIPQLIRQIHAQLR